MMISTLLRSSLFYSLLLTTLLAIAGCSRADEREAANDTAGSSLEMSDTSAGSGSGMARQDDRGIAPVDAPQVTTPDAPPENASSPSSSAAPMPTGRADEPRGPSPSESPAPMPGTPQPEQPATGRGPASDAPFGRDPNERLAMARAMLLSRPGLEHVIVDVGGDGCMILKGKVATAAKKQEAEALTRGVPGVTCMTSTITVGG